MLLTIAHHTTSLRFGTFLYDTEQLRREKKVGKTQESRIPGISGNLWVSWGISGAPGISGTSRNLEEIGETRESRESWESRKTWEHEKLGSIGEIGNLRETRESRGEKRRIDARRERERERI
eukprot:1379373-Amorphochlora_amoeboformis.AAC.1